MPRLFPLVASVAVGALVLLTHTSSAHADGPVAPAVAVVPPNVTLASVARVALSPTSASPMGSLLIVLDVLGIMEKDAPKSNAPARTATFLSAEPPKTPLFYSSLVVAKF